MVCAHIAETFERECVVDRTHTCEEQPIVCAPAVNGPVAVKFQGRL